MSQTGAQVTPSPAETPQVSIAALEDMLYEMLAVGMDPCESRVTSKEIQQFLFEHARAPKSREEFLSFFQAHGLSTDPESEARPLALGPAPSGANGSLPQPPPMSRPPRLQAGDGLSAPGGGMIEFPGFPTGPVSAFETELSVAEKRPGKALYLMCAGLAAMLVLLGAFAAIGYSHLVSLREELEQTRAAQALDHRAVERVDEQISTLGSRTADTGNLLADMEYKLDRMVEVVAPEPEPEPTPEP